MEKTALQRASEYFQKGDRKSAIEVLQKLTENEPANVEAWYGLAVCAEDSNLKRSYLEKVLELKPEHQKAMKMLESLKDIPANQPENAADIENEILRDLNKEPDPPQKKGVSLARGLFYAGSSLFILSIIVMFVWLVLRLDKTEKQSLEDQKKISVLQSQVTAMDSSIGNLQSQDFALDSRISTVRSQISAVSSDVNSLRSAVSSDLSSLRSSLISVASVADNANRYAHSHNTFSDVQLKTDIVEISSPLTRILLLQGVMFNWKVKEYPEMGFSDQQQIGFIAQDVEKVFPELVSTGPDGFKQIDYEKLTPVLVEAIKALQNEIAELKAVTRVP